ncbi:MAG: UDP-galactopyranose mutase [Ilumatobacteraceae bacterium]
MRQGIAIAGAGLTGATIARCLADAGRTVTVFDPRPHVAGNCHTDRDAETGVMVHRYGPHIFHTDSARVWDFVNRFATFESYLHRVRAISQGRSYQLPINLSTLRTFFGVEFDSDSARRFVAERASPYANRTDDTFESAALRTVGAELYEAFFRGYTNKQWGRSPAELPASVFARLPVRYVEDDSYFDHPHQGVPRHGYTAMVNSMLDHSAIELELATALDPGDRDRFEHVVWTGPLDEFFGCRLGNLTYRTLDFTHERFTGDRQGCAVVNHCDIDIPQTRSTEHVHFAPWEQHHATIVTTEVARAHEPGDIPYYPVRLAGEEARLDAYLRLADQVKDVTFAGRLGLFRYLDMDRAIDEALSVADRLRVRFAGVSGHD